MCQGFELLCDIFLKTEIDSEFADCTYTYCIEVISFLHFSCHAFHVTSGTQHNIFRVDYCEGIYDEDYIT